MIDANSLMSGLGESFFSVKISNGSFVVRGKSECSLGHKVADKGNKTDDGIYVEWKWDGTKLIVKNDRYGMYPLFYSLNDEGICISSSILPVLKTDVSKELDYPALSVLFRIGHMVGNDTPFKYISVLPPNSTLVWCDGDFTIKSEEVNSCFLSNEKLSYADAVDGYIHYFRESITRRLSEDPDFSVPISGGRDSRNILFELIRQGQKPKHCMTLRYRPPATNEDERVARLLADKFKIEHHVIEKPESWFHAVLNDIYMTNFCGGGHSWALPLADYCRDRSIRTIYDGLAGGIISSGQTLNAEKDRLFKDGRLEELAVRLLSESGFEDFNKRALKTDFYGMISMDVAVNRLVSELSTHMNSGNPALSYTFWNRTRRAVSSIPFSIMSEVKTVYCPYLDYEFFDFCTGIDTSYVLSGSFHDDVMQKAYPDFSGIPFENKRIKAVMNREGGVYYKESVYCFSKYLVNASLLEPGLIKKRYLFSRALIDVLSLKCSQPWYLRRALYSLELMKFC